MAVFERIDYAPDFTLQLWNMGEPYLALAGEIVLAAMHINLPASTDGSHGRPPGYARSRLKSLERGRDTLGPYRHVGTDATTPEGASYPAMLEYGTKPHVIEAHGPYSLRRGNRYFGRKVMHPGTKPIPWARRSAEALRGRRL